MLRSFFPALPLHRVGVLAGAMACVVASCTLATGLISSYKTGFQARIKITVASKLALNLGSVAFDTSVEKTIQAPKVRKVPVPTVRAQVLAQVVRPASPEVLDEEFAPSGIQLADTFEDLDGDSYNDEASETERLQLAAVVSNGWDHIAQVKVPPTVSPRTRRVARPSPVVGLPTIALADRREEFKPVLDTHLPKEVDRQALQLQVLPVSHEEVAEGDLGYSALLARFGGTDTVSDEEPNDLSIIPAQEEIQSVSALDKDKPQVVIEQSKPESSQPAPNPALLAMNRQKPVDTQEAVQSLETERKANRKAQPSLADIIDSLDIQVDTQENDEETLRVEAAAEPAAAAPIIIGAQEAPETAEADKQVSNEATGVGVFIPSALPTAQKGETAAAPAVPFIMLPVEEKAAGPVGPAPVKAASKDLVPSAAKAKALVATPAPTPEPTAEPTPEAVVEAVQMPEPPVTKPELPSYFTGTVVDAFSSGKRAAAGALVQILGTNLSTVTDEAGNFYFPGIKVDGVLPVIISKPDYMSRRIDLGPGRAGMVEILHKNAAALTGIKLGETINPDNGFVFGQLASTRTAPSVKGLRVEVVGASPLKAIYLDDNGIPNPELTATSSRGQFVLFNVLPGTYSMALLASSGEELAPHVLHVGRGEGIVRKFSLGEKQLITGRVLNAVMNRPVDNALVQLRGNSMQAATSRKGHFSLGPVFVDCTELNYLHVEKAGFYRNRLDFSCQEQGAKAPDYYVFSASHVDGAALDAQATLQSTAGVIVGHTNFQGSVKMQLWGPDELSPQAPTRGSDFYFDNDGVLNPALNRTTGTGNFLVMDAPDGLSYIQAFDKSNNTLSFWPILTSASTVNVYAQ